MAKHLADLGHEVTWLTLRPFEVNGVNQKIWISRNLVIISARYIPGLRTAQHISFMLLEMAGMEEKPEVVYATSDEYWGLSGFVTSKLFDIPLIFDFKDFYPEAYGGISRSVSLASQNFVLKNSDGVTCVSPCLEAYAKKAGAETTFLLPNGVDRRIFHPVDSQRARSVLGLPKSRCLIVYAGVLDQRVGVDVLLQALSDLIAQRKRSDVALVLVGSGSGARSIERSIMPRSRDLGIQDFVIMVGEVPFRDVPLYLNAADVLVIPNSRCTFNEFCFPLKLSEYMACKKPIIVSNVGVLPQVILNNHRGCVYSWDDHEELADKIVSVLEDERFASEVAFNAFTYATSNLSWGKLVGDFSSWVERLVG